MQNVRVWIGLLVVSAAAACGPIEPIRIIITPTHNTPATLVSTAESTVESTGATATDTVVLEATQQPIVITNTPPPSRTPVPGDGSFMGSALGSGYTITPPATNTPPAMPTADQTNPLPTVTPIVASAGALDPIEMGLHLYYNMGPDEWRDTLWLAQQTRVGWVKVQLDWSAMQPNSAGERNDVYNAFVLQAQIMKNFGFRTLLSVAKAPLWARGTNQNESGPPDNPQDLINFLQMLFTDIKAENIDALEIWNEPNLAREWQGALPFSGAGYMQLFVPVHDAMRSLFPGVHLVTAGLAPTGDSDVSVEDRRFLRQMFDAGLSNYSSVSVGIHPYGWGNAPDASCCNAIEGQGWDDQPQFFFLDTVDAYRDIMNSSGFQNAQLWVTEFGWATWTGYPSEAPEPWMTYTTPEQQAEYILRAFAIGQERADIGPMILWNLNFANQTLIENRDEKAGFSLIAPNLSGQGDPLIVRPIYTALRDRQQ